MLPEDAKAGTLPEYPNAKSCLETDKPFIFVIATPEILVHFKPPATVLSAIRTKLFEPTESFVNVDPVPTNKSPVE